MRVKLLKDVFEKDRFGAETLKVNRAHGRRKTAAFVEGAVIEMSNATAKKYIDNGLAVEYTDPETDTEITEED